MSPPPKPPSPREFWGYLISPDHPTQPTPLFRNLLLAIANYIVDNLNPRDVRCLTPEKIASFYHAVGGDLDDLFLGTPPAKLSSIYMTLGCSHSLQPTPDDDFVPPSIPALTSRGFVIWQTIQLLLDPEEHVPYLQEAARVFPLVNPETGEPFPREIPREAFPAGPDNETIRWHDEMFAKQKIKDDESKHGKVQVPVPPPAPGEHMEPGYAEYHRHHHHHAPAYQEHYVSSRSRKSRRPAPTPAPEPPVEDERYSRSAPGISDMNNPFTHHAPRHHTTHTSETVFASDSEGPPQPRSRRHSRHHSRRGTREREFPKQYHYENGVVTPVIPIFTNPSAATAADFSNGIHIHTELGSSPPLPKHFHHGGHPNYHSPTVTAPDPLSCSSSNSDLHEAYHSHHHSRHHSPQHLSYHHPHRPRSSSPLRPAEPALRKSQSAYYYPQETPVHHSHSRSRSGGSGRRIRRENISDMDSDVSDRPLSGVPGWSHDDRTRAEEEEHRARRTKDEMEIERQQRRALRQEWEYNGGGGGGGGGGRSKGGRRHYREFNPARMEGFEGAYFY